MKINSVELLGRRWNSNTAALVCSSLLALQVPILAADGLPLLDAPGPGYREQSARVKEPPAPARLEPISFMYPFMAPQPVFDGEAPDQPRMLPRGEFKLLGENEGWNFRVYDARDPAQSQVLEVHRGNLLGVDRDPPAKSAPILDVPIPSEAEAPPSPARTTEERDAVRLPVIPEVILPAPKEVEAANASAQPFADHLPFELRAP